VEPGDDAVYQAAFWAAETAKLRAAGALPSGYLSATEPLQEAVGELLARHRVRSVVHAYCGLQSWLPPVIARLAAGEAARAALARMQAAGAAARRRAGRGGEGGGAAAAVGAETAGLGAAQRRHLEQAGREQKAAERQQRAAGKKGATGKAAVAAADPVAAAAARAAARALPSSWSGAGAGAGTWADDPALTGRPPSFHYYGIDVACDQIQTRRAQMGAGDHWARPNATARPARAPPGPGGVAWRFDCVDAAHQGLPRGADLVATFDTLEHLPIESAFMFLSAVKASGARWLLLGGRAGGAAPNREPRAGVSGYYGFDPTSPPFNLRPPPLKVIEMVPPGGRPPGVPGGAGGANGSSAGVAWPAPGSLQSIKGRAEVDAAEAQAMGRRVLRLYNVSGLAWDDGMYEIFNYSRPAQYGGGGGGAGPAASGGGSSGGGSGGPGGAGAPAAGARSGAAQGKGGGAGHAPRRTVPSFELPPAAAREGAQPGAPDCVLETQPKEPAAKAPEEAEFHDEL
jgi:hypothetical protein